MADSLITNLTSRATLDGTEEIPLNLPGTPDVDRKATIAAVKTYAQADLGTAAFADTGDFATAAQGALADTAVQPADIGTAAAEDVGYFATAAQGALAATALQPAEVKSANFTAANDGLYVVTASATITDPSPTEGKGYTVIVRNGTATISGTGYDTAGSQIRRLFHSGSWSTYVDVLTTDARLSDARTPTAHASSHVTGGSDKIRDASASQDGLMTTAYATKLDGIEAAADVTDAGNVGSSIHGATSKTTPVDGDTMPLIDSAASNVLKKVTWANIKATLKTYWDTLYALTGSISSSGLTMSTARLLGRTTASTGAVEELTATAATAFLNAMVGDSGSGGTKGLVPAPAAGDAAGGKYLKADGTWASPSGGSGKILQVVLAEKKDPASVTGTTFGSVFTAPITPSSATSKVLILASLNVSAAASNAVFVRLTKSGSILLQGDAASSRTRVTSNAYSNQPSQMLASTVLYLDSPASTSALTYEIEIASSGSGAVYLNRSATDTDSSAFPRAASTILLMEVAA
jgi:hypothetical protein